MRRLVALVLSLFLVAAGSGLAGRGDPQKRITPADQKRAKTMLLRKSDLGLAVTGVRPPSTGESDFYCASLDASDLIVTGEAQSPEFQLGVQFASSAAQVYRTVAESNTSWRRATSPAGRKCAASEFRRLARSSGLRFRSMRPVKFPRVAQRSAAYRVTFTVATQSGTFRILIDLIALQHGRAQAALFHGTALGTPSRDLEVDLARTLARRMAKAMRGA